MNSSDPLKAERDAAVALERFLQNIPRVEQIAIEPDSHYDRLDVTANFTFAGHPLVLVCEVKSSGQPRFVREAINQLTRYLNAERTNFIPVVIAPFLSEQSQQLCREAGVGYLDFEGNARIDFDTVFIERKVATQPKTERRALRSLFKPKSARILRLLLREPARAWRVAELAQAAEVSVGHVSTIGSALRDRDWAGQSEEGLVLTDPDRLLDAWAEDYEPPEGRQLRLYTHLHGAALEAALREAMADEDRGRVVLGSYSAADWLAPYGRNPNRYLYADRPGSERLVEALQLSHAEKGGNIIVRIPDEDGVFADAVRPEPSIACTSPVQTYLDLTHAGERAREAADHLRSELLQWR